jgi:hypothetical protein
VAREWPDGFRLVRRHAPANRSSRRTHSICATSRSAQRTVVTPLVAQFAEWAAQTLFDQLVDAVLDWLDHGDASTTTSSSH